MKLELNLFMWLLGIYNRFWNNFHLTKQKNQEVEVKDADELDEVANIGLKKALDVYRKIHELQDLTEKQQEELEKKLKETQNREIVEIDKKEIVKTNRRSYDNPS